MRAKKKAAAAADRGSEEEKARKLRDDPAGQMGEGAPLSAGRRCHGGAELVAGGAAPAVGGASSSSYRHEERLSQCKGAQVLGFDVMIDASGTLHLIEVGTRPLDLDLL